MARIAGVNVPDHQHIVIGLTSIYGMAYSCAKDLRRDWSKAFH